MADIVRWDPLGEIQRVRDDFGRFFGRLWPWDHEGFPAVRVPSVDLRETGTHFVVSAEIPGVEPDDLDVIVTEDSVTLRGEVKERKEHDKTGYKRLERRYGAFHRTITLPAPVDPNQSTAEYVNGVLEVRLAKADPPHGKGVRLPIRAARPEGQQH